MWQQACSTTIVPGAGSSATVQPALVLHDVVLGAARRDVTLGDTGLAPALDVLFSALGTPAAEIAEDRVAAVREAARVTGAVVLLKGHLSLIAAPGSSGGPDGPVAINPTGNAGMAIGGSGDVLTGTVGALLAQRLPAWDAACLGAFVHGVAADLIAAQRGPEAIPAGDIANALPDALAALRKAGSGRGTGGDR